LPFITLQIRDEIIGWEGVGFWLTRIKANKAAMKAMLINRIGDNLFKHYVLRMSADRPFA
jgi:hypothetical protein